MTDRRRISPPQPTGVSRQPLAVVREYHPGDYRACRSLWVELTDRHRRIYGDSTIGGEDPGAAFDAYLATPGRAGCWVAQVHGVVVGLTGLFDRGSSGEVEPVVVAEAVRARGVGRQLIDRVVQEALSRGYQYLTIRPVTRNVEAIARFHAAGFRTMGGHVDLTMDLVQRPHPWLPGVTLHGLEFDY